MGLDINAKNLMTMHSVLYPETNVDRFNRMRKNGVRVHIIVQYRAYDIKLYLVNSDNYFLYVEKEYH